MQGFVDQRAVKDADTDIIVRAQGKAAGRDFYPNYLVTLITRRSTKRPGLRYLRRGIDDNGGAYFSESFSPDQFFGSLKIFGSKGSSLPVQCLVTLTSFQ